jgi:hypothetical protein
MILPANINAAINKVDYQKGTADGKGLSYLWSGSLCRCFSWHGFICSPSAALK